MFSGSAPGFAPLLPGGYGRGLDDGGVARGWSIDPPIRLLLTVGHNLLTFLSVLGDFQLEKKFSRYFKTVI